ncbi:hypothetical protein FB451DRAFT_1161682 [Mycena latifolia]|nr:hypothetical protein FB451DRAFT_1161682 [Mycena latifolia]
MSKVPTPAVEARDTVYKARHVCVEIEGGWKGKRETATFWQKRYSPPFGPTTPPTSVLLTLLDTRAPHRSRFTKAPPDIPRCVNPPYHRSYSSSRLHDVRFWCQRRPTGRRKWDHHGDVAQLNTSTLAAAFNGTVPNENTNTLTQGLGTETVNTAGPGAAGQTHPTEDDGRVDDQKKARLEVDGAVTSQYRLQPAPTGKGPTKRIVTTPSSRSKMPRGFASRPPCGRPSMCWLVVKNLTIHRTLNADLQARDSFNIGAIYSTSRVPSFSDYGQPLKVDVSLPFKLPTTAHSHERQVSYKGTRYRIWSPNSQQDPYYPGRFISNIPLPHDPPLPDRTLRRFDGHLGPQDPTISPQYFNIWEPWLPFIKRDLHDAFLDGTPIEFIKIYDLWEVDDYCGRISQTFIETMVIKNQTLDSRVSLLKSDLTVQGRKVLYSAPAFSPSRSEIQKLQKIKQYDAAVDEVRRLQRLLLKKQAWIDMAVECVGHHREQVSIPSVDDTRMGVWLNGDCASESQCLWLLTMACIPCFIIEQLRGKAANCENVASSFICGTPVESYYMIDTEYEYDAHARFNQAQVTGNRSWHWQPPTTEIIVIDDSDEEADEFKGRKLNPIRRSLKPEPEQQNEQRQHVERRQEQQQQGRQLAEAVHGQEPQVAEDEVGPSEEVLLTGNSVGPVQEDVEMASPAPPQPATDHPPAQLTLGNIAGNDAVSAVQQDMETAPPQLTEDPPTKLTAHSIAGGEVSGVLKDVEMTGPAPPQLLMVDLPAKLHSIARDGEVRPDVEMASPTPPTDDPPSRLTLDCIAPDHTGSRVQGLFEMNGSAPPQLAKDDPPTKLTIDSIERVHGLVEMDDSTPPQPADPLTPSPDASPQLVDRPSAPTTQSPCGTSFDPAWALDGPLSSYCNCIPRANRFTYLWGPRYLA